MSEKYEEQKKWRKKPENIEKYSEYRYRCERNRKYAYPKQIWAANKVCRAAKTGVIKKEPCHSCGSRIYIQAHITDLTAPLSNIVWLCDTCNKKFHKNIKNPEAIKEIIGMKV